MNRTFAATLLLLIVGAAGLGSAEGRGAANPNYSAYERNKSFKRKQRNLRKGDESSDRSKKSKKVASSIKSDDVLPAISEPPREVNFSSVTPDNPLMLSTSAESSDGLIRLELKLPAGAEVFQMIVPGSNINNDNEKESVNDSGSNQAVVETVTATTATPEGDNIFEFSAKENSLRRRQRRVQVSCPPDGAILLDAMDTITLPGNMDSELIICSGGGEVLGAYFYDVIGDDVIEPPSPPNSLIVPSKQPSELLSNGPLALPSRAPSSKPSSSIPSGVPSGVPSAVPSSSLSSAAPIIAAVPIPTLAPTPLDPDIWFYYKWKDLPVRLQEAAIILDYNETTWDSGSTVLTTYSLWSQMTDVQKDAARVFTYDAASWNEMLFDVIYPGWYDNDSWADLPQEVQEAAEHLGYTQALWDDWGETDTALLRWDQLSPLQKQAARVLGYNSNEDWDLE